MKPVQTMWKAFDRINASGAEAARPKVRRAPGISSSQANTIVTDLQNLKNAMTTTDSTRPPGQDRRRRGGHRQGRRTLHARQ
jgi:hypothetical protein